MAQSRYNVDMSLALINRTGAYYVCRDVTELLPQFFVAKRYWRQVLLREPRGLLRKLLGRAMLFEFGHLKLSGALAGPRPRPIPNLPTLFFDPLYVLQAYLEASDIVLCHDIGPVSHRHLYESKTAARYAEAYATIKAVGPGMVFVSQAVRTAFLRHFGNDFRFLQVIPLYVRSSLTETGEKAPSSVSRPFLLTVAALESRKNYNRIIEAFVRSGLRERGYSYVFCGPRGNSAATVLSLAGATPGVRYLDFVGEDEVRWLYRYASGFVLPSLLEGFGLPALEAAQYGLLSVIGQDQAQSEAVGGSAIQVDATSVSDIADGLRRLVDMSESERAERVEMARQHAANLTQEKFLQKWSELLLAQTAGGTLCNELGDFQETSRGVDLEAVSARLPT